MPEITRDDLEKELGVNITETEFAFIKEKHLGQNAMGKLQILMQCRWHELSRYENKLTAIADVLRNKE